MNLSRVLYFGDFVACPVAVLVLAILALAGRDIEATGLWVLMLITGVAVWTLVEYVIHRWVYHRVAFFQKYHDAHHMNPRGLIGAPSFYSVGIILGVFFAPLLGFGLVAASGFASGVLLGYTGYMLVHHLSHHLEPRPGSPLYEARLRHMAHHYHGIEGNYGVTTSFWDRVFSTSLERRRRRPTTRTAS
jgi:sterol desaturase/sphingolipid hydroxylase (fatty acid hydroxylase superfamily)